MKNSTFSRLLVFLIILCSPLVYSAQTDVEVMQLVKLTNTAIQQNAGHTFEQINASQHPYRDKQNPALYVFVFDTELNVIAHAVKHGIVGKNVKGKPDIKGKMFRDEILALALDKGSGWVDYYFKNPKSGKEEHKVSYIELAEGSDGKRYIVGSGKYFDD